MTLLPRTLMSMKWRSCLSKAASSSAKPANPGGVARFQADPLAAERVAAVVQGDLQHLDQVEIAGQDVAFAAEGPGLHAARGAAAAGVGQRLALAQHLGHQRLGIEQRRLAEAGAHDLQRPVQEGVGVLAADLHHGAGLQQAHLLDHLEDEEGDLVDAVLALGVDAAGVDQGEIGVGAALLGRDPHLGRRGMVVELHPEGLQQLAGLFAGQAAVGQAAAVEGEQVLVEAAGVEGVPGVGLADHAQVDEPVVLQRLMEVARRLRRHALADGGDAQQLLFARRVLFPGGQLPRPGGVAAGEGDHGRRRPSSMASSSSCLASACGSLKKSRAPRLARISACRSQQPLGVDLFAAHGVAGGALLHELGEDARLVGVEPLRGHVGEEALAHGLAPPVGDDLVGEVAAGGGADAEAGLLAPVQDVQVAERMAGDLGVGGGGLGRRPPFADDQLVGQDDDLLAGQQVGEGAGALARDGEAVGGAALVVAGQQAAAFAGKHGNGPQRAGAQSLDPFVHVSLRSGRSIHDSGIYSLARFSAAVSGGRVAASGAAMPRRWSLPL